jgi:hypothetical protein
MTEEESILWSKIKAFEFDNPGSELSFTDRLARENGWTMEYSLRAVAEYKKFMFLICVAKHPLTPSDQIDQVWHLHLLYTQLYWDDFCRDTLNRPIHHGPTKGGKAEGEKFTNWYEKTKEVYERYFNVKPPLDLWPDSKTRFSDINFVRVNKNKNWIIKKPGWL